MKNALRMGIMFLLSVVFCLCAGRAVYAEVFSISDTEMFDAHGVYVNEENFPDDNFRQYVLNNYGTYLSSGEIASTKVFDCSHSYSVDVGIEPPPDDKIGEQTTYDPNGNTIITDSDGNNRHNHLQ